MSEIIYLNVSQSSVIQRPVVRIGDIAEVFCENETVENQIRKIAITEFKPTKSDKKVFSTCSIIQRITDIVPNCQVESLGETDFIVYFKPVGKSNVWKDRCKSALVCLIAFFGAAFSIMTFNTDVTTSELFNQLYELFTGNKPEGPGILQLAYSIGLFLGVILFFNHGGKYKLTNDPTPLQVQMRQYEQSVNQAFIIDAQRNQESTNVD